MARPKIGLALGSGVARGWAHIGVIQALEQHGIVPDIFAGTSIGALVGGVYLAKHMDTLAEWALSLNRMRLVRYLDVQFGGGGLIAGRRLTALLEENLGDMKIEALPKPFVAVTTELATGHEFWARDGHLVNAIRASYALPGVFSPVQIDDRWLVDGALVNPVPVSVCRALGARLVIAVNLNADVFGKSNATGSAKNAKFRAQAPDERGLEELAAKPGNIVMRQLFGHDKSGPNMFSVMVGSLNIIQDRLSRSRLAGDPPDVVVAPRLGHIGLLEFHRAEEAIAEGILSVERSMPFIRDALAVLSR
jgi:NTE family protein